MGTDGVLRLALLNDFALVARGLEQMLRPFDQRVQIVDVQAQAPIDARVDIVLYDTFGAPDDDEHWSQFIGHGWAPDYVVLYSWATPARDPRPTTEIDTTVIRLSKALDGETLVRALEQIRATGTYTAPPVLPAVHSDATGTHTPHPQRQWPGRSHGLSERESEIVTLIVEGLSNHELAARLFLGINTVKTYIRTAYRKMGVESRSNAVLWGIDHGFRRQRPSG